MRGSHKVGRVQISGKTSDSILVFALSGAKQFRVCSGDGGRGAGRGRGRGDDEGVGSRGAAVEGCGGVKAHECVALVKSDVSKFVGKLLIRFT